MPELTIEFTWGLVTPSHVGTGLSQVGYVDRLVRSWDGCPYLPGDAVKGAIRASAERLYRWLDPNAPKEAAAEPSSVPDNAVLRRIFAPQLARESNSNSPIYRFHPARSKDRPRKIPRAGTAIETVTGTAKEQSLRVIETWDNEFVFDLRVSATYGHWDSRRDSSDLQFLIAAILCTDAVGGKRGTGLGRISCKSLRVSGLPPDIKFDIEEIKSLSTVEELRKHLAPKSPHENVQA